MGIKALCAAAAVVVACVGAADAATVVWKRKVEINLSSTLSCLDPEDYGEDCAAADLPEFMGLPTNTPLTGFLTITERPDTLWATLIFASPQFNATIYDNWVDFADGKGSGLWQDFSGRSALIELFGNSGRYRFFYDDRPFLYDAETELTLAPVPLPASAALLPLGIGALAMLRKRRRSA